MRFKFVKQLFWQEVTIIFVNLHTLPRRWPFYIALKSAKPSAKLSRMSDR